MYTQCPDCTTVFRVTAETLRAAGGDVRCGVCSTSFNALENLSEEPYLPVSDDGGTGVAEDTITVEEVPGTEVIELATAQPEPDAPAEAAPVQEASLEFDGNAEDLDRLFVTMSADDSLDRTDEFPILVLDEQDEPEPQVSQPEPQVSQPEPRASQPEPQDSQPEPLAAPHFVIPEEMRRGLAEEAAASAAALRAFEEPEPAGRRRRWPWRLGVALLALTLAAQVVHSRRDGLIQTPAVGPVLAQVYALTGFPLADPTNLSAYELRQWGAASDAMQPGRLRLRASIVNRATYAQPYPLLRLTLQDRFGATVGVRDIEPADYMPGAAAMTLLDPGQRADAEIRIVDPGHDAVGFEMDVCLPSAAGVRCANEARPAVQ